LVSVVTLVNPVVSLCM